VRAIYTCLCTWMDMHFCVSPRDGPVLPINRDIFFDNNQYRAIFTANNNRKEQ